MKPEPPPVWRWGGLSAHQSAPKELRRTSLHCIVSSENCAAAAAAGGVVQDNLCLEI